MSRFGPLRAAGGWEPSPPGATVRRVRHRTLERGKRGAAALVALLAVLTLTAAVPSASARPRISEAALRAYEARVLGPAHAAEHAAERGAARRWKRRWRRMSPAARRRW